MNEFKIKINEIGALPKNPVYENLMHEFADNVIAYDMHNNYFTFETTDPITGNILIEAINACGHSGQMASYGHLKFMLTYGFLPFSLEEGRVVIDMEEPQHVITLEAFGEKGLGYGDVMKESVDMLEATSKIVSECILKKKPIEGPLKMLHESYQDIKEKSMLPNHWFDDSVSQYALIVEKKKPFAEKFDMLIVEGKTSDDEAQKLFERALMADEKFFELCRQVGKTLLKVVETVAIEIAENKGVEIDLSKVEYRFVSEDEIFKQFYDNQYKYFGKISETLMNHYGVSTMEDLVKAISV